MRPEHWLFTILLRLRSLFRWAQADQELHEELRDHLERKTEEYVAQGMTQEEAHRRARLDLGGIEQTKEKCRDARGVNWIQDSVQDLRFGLRMLHKSPGFTTVAILTLALGIGANTAIFQLLDSVRLRSMPVPNPQELDGLAIIGLYGVMSYIVIQRRNEIGIRVALGAKRGQIISMVMLEAGALLLIGAVIGAPMSLAAGRGAESLLFGLSSSDPLTLALAIVLLVVCGAVARFLPAHRASNTDPMAALRYE